MVKIYISTIAISETCDKLIYSQTQQSSSNLYQKHCFYKILINLMNIKQIYIPVINLYIHRRNNLHQIFTKSTVFIKF